MKPARLVLAYLLLLTVAGCFIPRDLVGEIQTTSPGQRLGSSPAPSDQVTPEEQAKYEDLLAGRVAASIIRQYALPIYTASAEKIEAETAPRERELLDNLKKYQPGTTRYELDMSRLNSLRSSKDALLREAKREAIDTGTLKAIDAVLAEALRSGSYNSNLAAYVMLKFNEAKGYVSL
jgi:hypothetical protein